MLRPLLCIQVLRAHGLDDLVAFVAKVLNDERIRNPDSRVGHGQDSWPVCLQARRRSSCDGLHIRFH